MLGTWRWNVGFGLFGAILTIAFSIGANPVPVMLLRSLYAFIAFFVLSYAVRAVLAFILKPPAMIGEQAGPSDGSADGVGEKLDMRTPDETDDLNQLLKSRIQEGAPADAVQKQEQESTSQFKPLNPPQLLSAKNSQPEELAKAVRHLTGE